MSRTSFIQPYIKSANDCIGKMHNQVETYISSHLKKPSAQMCMNNLRSLPFAIALIFTPSIISIPVGLATAGFFFYKPEIIEKNNRVKLLQALAQAYFTNIFVGCATNIYSQNPFALMEIPVNMAMSGLYYYMASRAQQKLVKESQ